MPTLSAKKYERFLSD